MKQLYRKMDKRDRADLFRKRLLEALEGSGLSRSDLARQSGAQRSTIAQLLNAADARLPNAHLAANVAQILNVSSDWLLGLTHRRETSAELLVTSFKLTDAQRSPADRQLAQWLNEARGQKIRHIPTTLPDILKTRAFLEYEYESMLEKTPEQASSQSEDGLRFMSEPGSDYEFCVSSEMLQQLLRGDGYWRDCPGDIRREQIRFMISRLRDLYPSLRLYVYNIKRVYSAPLTVFGNFLAIVYIGNHYIVYTEPHQINSMTVHFNDLVKAAQIDASIIADRIEEMARDVGAGI